LRRDASRHVARRGRSANTIAPIGRSHGSITAM
jgi:hypothetical protein